VTALFADLVGFTSRAEQLDPEDVRALLAPYHSHLRAELERYGGTVEKFIGDAVMALFGAPVTHEDDPERAVRAALAIRDWAREHEDELRLRIAVNTGEALIALGSRPEAGEGMASGDVVNTTARLQAAAPVNGILVGETTHRATRHAIDYAEREPVSAKGKAEPIPVWEAMQARAAHGVDLLRDVYTPLVGRTRELEALRNALARVSEERTPQLVTLVGVPGIGKSRLVYELLQLVEAEPGLIAWRQGRSLPYGEGVSFWPVAEIVKAQAGILESDPPAEVETKLRHAAEGIVVEDLDWVVGHLQRLLGHGDDVAVATERRAEAFAAWRRFLEALGELGPAVLVFEDLHWADDGTLDFVDHLVEWASGVPLLVVGTARPELLERRSAWGGGKTNALTLALSPLSDEETARLIAALAKQPLLDATTQQGLLAHAEGNPLYAEQYVRMVLERSDKSELPLPETVHGIIAARLDSLGPDEKSLIQNAAVLGKVFWAGAAAALGDNDPHGAAELFHGLERKEFVQRARRSSVAGETEYSFRHVLVRDVAYAQIPRAARAEKHQRAADWIETLGRPEEHAEMVAHHLTTALEFAGAAGIDTAGLERDARRALRRAANRAAGLGSLPAAAAFYERLLELTPRDDPGRAQLLYRYIRVRTEDYEIEDALLEEARAALRATGDSATAAEAEAAFANIYWLRGDRDACLASVARAVELISDQEASPEKAYVLAQASRFEMLAGHDEHAIELGRGALELGERFRLDEVRARSLDNIGVSRVNVGDVGGIEDLKRSLAIGEAANSIEAWQAASNMASMFFQLGYLKKAEEMRSRARAINERFGIPGFERWSLGEDVESFYQRGRWDEAATISKQWLEDLGPSGHYLEATVRVYRSQLSFARDDVDAAVQEGELSLQRARVVKDPQVLEPILAWWAFLTLNLGRQADAADSLDELLTEWGGVHCGYANGAVAPAWVAHALGRGPEVEPTLKPRAPMNLWANAALHIVRGEFTAAADIIDQIGSLPDAAYARLRAAHALVDAERRAEADEQLGRALTFYRSVGAARYVREAEALPAATA
jgi:class 3 adenylate cyclase/tetratricopeptide (TPR) repeat protein